MSRIFIDLVPEFQGLKPPERFVLYRLADYASDQGICWPGTARLCWETGYNESTVYNALNVLEGMGILKRQTATGRGTTYFLLFHNALIDGTKEVQKNQKGRATRVITVQEDEEIAHEDLEEDDHFKLRNAESYKAYMERLGKAGYNIHDIRVQQRYITEKRAKERASGRKV